MSGLNLLHILVVLSAGACFYYALREAPRRTVRLRRMFWAPWAGSVAALLWCSSSSA
jgi:3-methyladenine DNA glycosylase/8-oxoguanine DNA glycosylase